MIELEKLLAAFLSREYFAEWLSPSEINWLTTQSHFVIIEDGFAFKGCLSVCDADQFSASEDLNLTRYTKCSTCEALVNKLGREPTH